MISEIKCTGKIIDTIKDHLGRIVYEAWKQLTKIGIPPLQINSKGEDLQDYKIYGESVQNGTPTPSNPIEIESVGDKTKNLFDSSKVASSTIKVQDNGRTIIMPLNKSGNGYTYTGKTLAALCPDLKVGDTVILNFNTTSPSRNIIYSEALGSWFTGKTKTITQAMLDASVALYGNNYTAGETEQVIITDFQIEKGTVVTEYEPFGYKVPIKVNDTVTNIYLKEPLRKTGEYSDYIDFKNQKVFRNVEVLDDTGTLTIAESYQGITDDVGMDVELPNIPTIKGTSIIEVDTSIQPSNMEVTCLGKK